MSVQNGPRIPVYTGWCFVFFLRELKACLEREKWFEKQVSTTASSAITREAAQVAGAGGESKLQRVLLIPGICLGGTTTVPFFGQTVTGTDRAPQLRNKPIRHAFLLETHGFDCIYIAIGLRFLFFLKVGFGCGTE